MLSSPPSKRANDKIFLAYVSDDFGTIFFFEDPVPIRVLNPKTYGVQGHSTGGECGSGRGEIEKKILYIFFFVLKSSETYVKKSYNRLLLRRRGEGGGSADRSQIYFKMNKVKNWKGRYVFQSSHCCRCQTRNHSSAQGVYMKVKHLSFDAANQASLMYDAWKGNKVNLTTGLAHSDPPSIEARISIKWQKMSPGHYIPPQ